MNLRSTIQKNIEDALETLYDKNQPRGKDGKWTKVGGGVQSRFLDPSDAELFNRYSIENDKFFNGIAKEELQDFIDSAGGRGMHEVSEKIRKHLRDNAKEGYNALTKWQSGTKLSGPTALKYAAMTSEKLPNTIKFIGTESDIAKQISEFSEKGISMKPDYIFIRSMNQSYMERMGIDDVTLYRGQGGRSGNAIANDLKSKSAKGTLPETLTYTESPLSGYSSEPGQARYWGRGKGGVEFVLDKVKREDIFIHRHMFSFLTGTYVDEAEFILISGKRSIPMDKVLWGGGR